MTRTITCLLCGREKKAHVCLKMTVGQNHHCQWLRAHFQTVNTLPVSFCTSSQANALWRGEPVSADTITEDKQVYKTVMLSSALLGTQGEGREGKKKA